MQGTSRPEIGVGKGVTHQLVEGCLFSSVLVQGLYQLICSAALPQNPSGSATEAAKWVLYSPPPPEESARQPRPPRALRGPGATYALRAGPAPRAWEDPGRGPPSPPAPVTLRHCSQDGFIAASGPRPLQDLGSAAPECTSQATIGVLEAPWGPRAAGGRREAGANGEVSPSLGVWKSH